MAAFDVLCVGAVNHDTIAVVDDLPADDERIIAREMIVGHGGPAAQAAVTLARLGHRVALCSSVGDDPEGRSIVEGLAAEGVDVDHITVEHGATTAKTVVIANRRTGARSIITSGYHSTPVAPPLGIAPIVHVDQAGWGVVDAARRHTDGAFRLSIDGGNPIPDLHLEGVWLYAPTLSVLTGGELEPGEAAERRRSEGAQVVVATDGGRGSWWFGATQTVHAASVPVEVVSTLGAGDVFHGALLSALVDEREPEDALRWANACAALSCRAVDGRSGIPRRAELEEFVARAASVGADR
jgi:sulfofructose kinase